MIAVFFILAFDSLLYLVLALYFDKILLCKYPDFSLIFQLLMTYDSFSQDCIKIALQARLNVHCQLIIYTSQ